MEAVLFALGIVTGGVAMIVGFGVGSFLTPVLALQTSFATAVAAVGFAHIVSGIMRFWILRRDINKLVLLRFGALSAVGALVGAVFQSWAANDILAILFGVLLLFAGVAGLFKWTEKLHIKGPMAAVVGLVSGFFGGLVGNQGGLRAAGLMEFKLGKTEFVATMTAVGLAVDVFRLPVYVATRGAELAALLPQIIIMAIGIVIGTLLGAPILRKLPEEHFRVVLSTVIIIVGVLVMAGH